MTRGQLLACEKPMVVTLRELNEATAAMHQWQRGHLDSLHDIWKMGAPSPDSIIRRPDHYDPRYKQAGNVEKRIVFPAQLARWIEDVTAARGMPLAERQAWNIAHGNADYAFDMHSRPIIQVVRK